MVRTLGGTAEGARDGVAPGIRVPGARVLDEIDAMFRAPVDAGAAPGIAYGVVGRDGLLHAGGHGITRADGPRPDATTAFRIASMTKSFTAASIMLLAERGALALADPVRRHVPEFGAVRLPTSDSPQVTVGMLLSMSGGLPEDDAWADRQESMTREDFARLLAAGVRFAGVPGTAYEYSNLGYALLGRVVEAASGMPYHDAVARHLLAPLGMTSTGWDASVPAPGGVAHGHARLDGRWRAEPFSGPGVFSAIGGLFSTVEDLAVWMRHLAGAFPARDGADPGPLSRAARRDMQQAHRAIPPIGGASAGPVRVGYGYGLGIEHDPPWGVVVSHSGGYPGFGSHMRWHPGTGLGVAALTNARYVTGKAQATAALRALLTDAATTAPVGGGGVPSGDGARTAEATMTAAATGPTDRAALWPETVQARAAVERLVRGWDPGLAAAWFADNVALDLDLARRRAAIEALAEAAGPPLDEASPSEIVRSDSPAHVVWRVRGTRGALRCEIRLTPQDPPKIQALDVTLDDPASSPAGGPAGPEATAS